MKPSAQLALLRLLHTGSANWSLPDLHDRYTALGIRGELETVADDERVTEYTTADGGLAANDVYGEDK